MLFYLSSIGGKKSLSVKTTFLFVFPFFFNGNNSFLFSISYSPPFYYAEVNTKLNPWNVNVTPIMTIARQEIAKIQYGRSSLYCRSITPIEITEIVIKINPKIRKTICTPFHHRLIEIIIAISLLLSHCNNKIHLLKLNF